MKYTRSLFGEESRNIRKKSFLDNGVGTGPNHAVAEIMRILSDAETSGAVICSSPGSDQSDLIQEACEALGLQPRVIRLNGNVFTKKMQLGVFSFLLAQAELPKEPTRHELVHALGRIMSDGAGAPIVLLGSPGLIDAVSGSLLAQLASTGSIKLFVTCGDLKELPTDISSLLRSGQLVRVSIANSTLGETRAMLESEFSGRFSIDAVSYTHYLADGRSPVVLDLTRLMIATGQLLKEQDTWVIRSLDFCQSALSQSFMQSLTKGLRAEELKLLYALAVGGPVTEDKVHQAQCGQPLDHLVQAGLVHAVPSATHCFDIAIPVLSIMLRNEIQNGSDSGVDQLMRSLHTEVHTARTLADVLELAVTKNLEGLVQRSQIYATDGYASESWPIETNGRKWILKLHARGLAHLGRADEALSLVEHAVGEVDKALGGAWQQARLLRTRQELALLFQELVMRSNYANPPRNLVAATELEGRFGGWLTQAMHLRFLAIQSANFAVRNLQNNALGLVEFIDQEMSLLGSSGELDNGFCADQLADIEEVLLQTQLICGEYASAMQRASQLAAGKYMNPQIIIHAEYLRGMLGLVQADYDQALHVLLPSRRQMEMTADSKYFESVNAAVDLALLSLGRQNENIQTRTSNRSISQQNSDNDVQSWFSVLFTTLALAQRGALEEAQEKVVTYATLMKRRGFEGLAMSAFALAVRLGVPGASEKLAVSANHGVGGSASVYAALSEEGAIADSGRTSQLLQSLSAMGFALMATAENNVLYDALETKEQRKLVRMNSQVLRTSIPPLAEPLSELGTGESTAHRWAKQLTKRELEIALMAISGKTNLAIAKQNGVSIRTIEGHLYQVYAKLQVRNRQELSSLERASRKALV